MVVINFFQFGHSFMFIGRFVYFIHRTHTQTMQRYRKLAVRQMHTLVRVPCIVYASLLNEDVKRLCIYLCKLWSSTRLPDQYRHQRRKIKEGEKCVIGQGQQNGYCYLLLRFGERHRKMKNGYEKQRHDNDTLCACVCTASCCAHTTWKDYIFITNLRAIYLSVNSVK